MEYAKQLSPSLYNDLTEQWPKTNYQDNRAMRFVGWGKTLETYPSYSLLFSDATVEKIQKRVMEIIKESKVVDRPVIVSEETIYNVMSEVSEMAPANVGDMYLQYNIPQQHPRCDPQTIIKRTINIIASYIINEYGIINANKKLSVWTTVLGGFNKHGLRSHPPIKLKERRTQPMMFNMNY